MRNLWVGIAIILLSSFMFSAVAWEWTQVSDFSGAAAIGFLFESSDHYIYTSVSPDGDLYRTNDGGTNWELMPALPAGKIVNCLMEAADGVLWAGAGTGGFVFKSDDGGLTWQGTAEMPDVTAVTCLLEASDGYIYAGTSANAQFGYVPRIFKTNDDGVTWQVTTQYPSGQLEIYRALVEASDGYIYAAANPDAILMRTNDGGLTWESGGVLPESYHGVVNFLINGPDGSLYATATTIGYQNLIGRVYRKFPNPGWIQLPYVPDAQSIGPVAAAPDGFLYVGTSLNGDVFRGYEYGNIWTYTADTPGTTTVQHLLHGSDGYLYAAGYPEGEIYRGKSPECEGLRVILEVPAVEVVPGDIYSCDVIACLSGPYEDVPVFVILDVYGNFFFAPSFDGYDHYTLTSTRTTEMMNVLPAFQWPTGAGSGTATWYAAMTDPEVTMLLGEMDMTFLNWSE